MSIDYLSRLVYALTGQDYKQIKEIKQVELKFDCILQDGEEIDFSMLIQNIEKFALKFTPTIVNGIDVEKEIIELTLEYNNGTVLQD